MSCQVQNSWTTPSDSGTFKTINQIQTDPVQKAMALSRRQFHDVSRLSPVKIPQVTMCPFSASDGKESTIYFTLDEAVQPRQTFDFSAFNRLITDMGSLNVTGPITNIHPPEASFFTLEINSWHHMPTRKVIRTVRRILPFRTPNICTVWLSPRLPNMTLSLTRYLTLHGTTRHDSCIDRTTQTISQTSEDDTVPNFLQADFTGRDKTQREKTQGG